MKPATDNLQNISLLKGENNSIGGNGASGWCSEPEVPVLDVSESRRV
jgi:hypothetical protein